MRSLFKAILATVALAAPMYANAIPMTWTYNGTCLYGDCGAVPSIHGTLVGDPTLRGPSDELNDPLIFSGDLLSYDFWIGSIHLSGDGSTAVGNYDLDSSGNIKSGSMTFGDVNLFSLRLLDVGATWSILAFGCDRTGCFDTDASGKGAYTRAVPEPRTLSLLGLGLLALGFAARRKASTRI